MRRRAQFGTIVRPSAAGLLPRAPQLSPRSLQIDRDRHVLGLPRGPHDLYISTFSYLKDALIIGASTTALTLLLGIPAAYALARFRLRAARLIILGILVA